MSENEKNSPTVAILYSHDNERHCNWVDNFVKSLKKNQINVRYDTDYLNYGDDLNQFMELLVTDSDIILPICTEEYKQHIDSRENGSGYEGRMLAQIIKDKAKKVIPIYHDNYSNNKTPNCLSGLTAAILPDNFDTQEFAKLLEEILDLKVEEPIKAVDPRQTIAKLAGTDIKNVKSKKDLDFVNIKIVKIVPEKVTRPKLDGSLGSALYSIPFQLNTAPPSEWIEYFLQHWEYPTEFTLMHRPNIASVNYDTIWLNGTTLDEVAKYHRNTLVLAVNEANKDYNNEIIKKEEKRIADEKAEAEYRKSIDEKSRGISF